MIAPSQSKNRMSWWLWIALVATLVLTYQMYLESSQEEADVIESISEANLSNGSAKPLNHPTNPEISSSTVEQATPDKDLASSNKTVTKTINNLDSLGRIESREMFKTVHSSKLFLPKQWLSPPPPVKAVVPPQPTAPPLPFVYVGEMDDMPTGKKVILMAQQKMHLPMLGEKVMGVWRLDKVDANAVYFTYLPLNLVKTLSKSAKSLSPINIGLAKPVQPPISEAPNL